MYRVSWPGFQSLLSTSFQRVIARPEKCQQPKSHVRDLHDPPSPWRHRGNCRFSLAMSDFKNNLDHCKAAMDESPGTAYHGSPSTMDYRTCAGQQVGHADLAI
jgi:hypothetical protein